MTFQMPPENIDDIQAKFNGLKGEGQALTVTALLALSWFPASTLVASRIP